MGPPHFENSLVCVKSFLVLGETGLCMIAVRILWYTWQESIKGMDAPTGDQTSFLMSSVPGS